MVINQKVQFLRTYLKLGEFNILLLEMWESEYPSKLFIVAVKWTTQPIDGLEYFPLSQHSCNLVESFPLPIYQRRSNLFPFLSPHLSENFREDVFILWRWNWLDDTIVHSWKVCWSLPRNHLAIGILYFGHSKGITSPLYVRKLISVDCLR